MPRKKVLHLFPELHNNVPGECFQSVGELANCGYGVTLEKRRNGRRYFYSAKRIRGRVVKKYLGGGEFGALIAGMAVMNAIQRRDAEDMRRQSFALVRDRWDGINRGVDSFLTRSYLQFSLFMEAAGYHRPNRGVWRKRWKGRVTESMGASAKAASAVAKADDDVERVNVGTLADRDVVRLAIENPDSASLRARAMRILTGGTYDPGTHLADDVDVVIRRFGEDNDAYRALYSAQYRELWREMTGTVSGSAEARAVPPVEKILVDRVIACRFVLVQAENARSVSGSLKVSEFQERNIDRAQRRLLSAVKCLAEVKRLGVPQVNVAMPGAVQVNVGEKQVNAALAPAAVAAS
jgi:hypothetical protein